MSEGFTVNDFVSLFPAGSESSKSLTVSVQEQLLSCVNLESVYEDLRHLAAWLLRSEKTALSLEEVDLVHEAYIRLTKSSQTLSFQSRKQLINLLVTTMRRVLIDHARHKSADKSGGSMSRVSLEGVDVSDDQNESGCSQFLLDLNTAIDRLAKIDSQGAQIVKLRLFAGLTFDEICELLGESRSNIYRQWMAARAWLKSEIDLDTT